MSQKNSDYIFETSWEICNKVGGIYTVLSTKAATVAGIYGDNYICIGPDISREYNDDFVEDPSLFRNWKEVVARDGLKVRIGRWQIVGSPVVFLVDFTNFFEKKNEILTKFWLNFKLDSITGQWDYIEPALFGYAAGRVIESFYNFYCNSMDKIVAHFHEWMTGTGILYIESVAPQIATVFTTHATVLGRCIAGNGLPLYGNIGQYAPVETAQRFGVQSKYSLESLSAKHADAYTTVSEITNRECEAFFERPADVITINGFENAFVPKGDDFLQKRRKAREKLLQVASALMQTQIDDSAFLVINSGRYEFKNKGVDVFVKSLAKVAETNPGRTIVAFITVPAGNTGRNEEIAAQMNVPVSGIPMSDRFLTHNLSDPYHDPILCELSNNGLHNSPDQSVKVVYVPVYLDGDDGIFNMKYYDLLIGFDLSVFPSYYEPWGYTPLESIAFGIPTITTSLAGFGAWVQEHFTKQESVCVIPRGDSNDDEVVKAISEKIAFYSQCTPQAMDGIRKTAMDISEKALWKNLFDNYEATYAVALEKTKSRYDKYQNKTSQMDVMVEELRTEKPKWHRISVKSQLPESLSKLERLSENLWWSWNYDARELFEEIAGEDLWRDCEENPIHMLQTLPLSRIELFADNADFIGRLGRVYDRFTSYMDTPRAGNGDRIAYFSMEFGISNELKIFSGGLGMLAGDYLKEASDCNANMVGVGLLYRYGYFQQQISAYGEQVNLYPPQSFSKLPLKPYKDENGDWLTVSIPMPGRNLYARIWRVDVGRIPLYLLDTDFDRNWQEDRGVTATLYGGDVENRLKQEILLGIGGVRMLKAVDEKPTIFHLNEGHAAFLNLERVCQVMQSEHVNRQVATEIVKSSSLYTTHTPVPAGHDSFTEDLMRIYFANYIQQLGVSWETFMGFGRRSEKNTFDKFSMSILACKFSQEINGVSRIHGRVSQEMFADLYEGHFPQESHIGYVTNGVHYPTWTHKRWQALHREAFGNGFLNDQSNPENWKGIANVDDTVIWGVKQELRKEMIASVKRLLSEQMRKRNESPALIEETLKSLRDDVLTIGFARRFATYKRAHLLFMNEEKLKKLLNNPEKPIQFIFAGKAHPHDKAGQDLIKRIIELSRRPEFVGKIVFVENYNMIIAKKLVSGCDVWMNTPTRPLEASGTSGEKAVMNGVLNLSVLDGWWAEGYVPGAGWALKEEVTYNDNRMQDELDAETLYNIINEEISETFYNRTDGVPASWVEMMRKCFTQISPNFTMKRQLDDYYSKFYNKLMKRHNLLCENNNENVRRLLKWEENVLSEWNNIECVSQETPQNDKNTFIVGEEAPYRISMRIGNLKPEDLKIEMLLVTPEDHDKKAKLVHKLPFSMEKAEDGLVTFACDNVTGNIGTFDCAVRVIPNNDLLPHDLDFNIVKWM
ncbi:MAG: alpha-glucan family phosphorylase [Bacteroidales bacterium]|nr:alpha-glucan family phosphorylase [Bacteroidales bacterium]